MRSVGTEVERSVPTDNSELLGVGPDDRKVGYFEGATHRVFGSDSPRPGRTDGDIPEVNRPCSRGSGAGHEAPRTRGSHDRRSKHPTPRNRPD